MSTADISFEWSSASTRVDEIHGRLALKFLHFTAGSSGNMCVYGVIL